MKNTPSIKDPYITALLSRDAAGIEQIYSDFSDKVVGLVKKQGGRETDAKDILQDALLIIWNKASDPDFTLTSSFGAYLMGVCKNLWLRKINKKGHNSVTLSEVEGYTSIDSIEDSIERQEQQLIFMENFNKLGDKCKKIMGLFFQGESMKKIATILQLETAHAARTQKYRCQKKLEQLIEQDPRYREMK